MTGEAEALARAAAAALLFAAGLVGSRLEAARALERMTARMLLYASVPLIVFYKVETESLVLVKDYAALVGWSMGGSLLLAAAIVPRLLRGYPRETVGAAVLAAGIHNAGFLPIPLALLLYGDPGPPALYSAMANLYMSFMMPAVAGAYSPRGGGLRGALRGLAGYPPLYALVLGFACRGLGCPSLPGTLYSAAAESTLASFYLVGSVLGRAGLGAEKPVVIVAAWRLVVEPALTLSFLSAARPGLQGVWLYTALMESFMPPATMNLVLSIEYGLDYMLVAKAIGVVTPVSIVLALLLRLLLGG